MVISLESALRVPFFTHVSQYLKLKEPLWKTQPYLGLSKLEVEALGPELEQSKMPK